MQAFSAPSWGSAVELALLLCAGRFPAWSPDGCLLASLLPTMFAAGPLRRGQAPVQTLWCEHCFSLLPCKLHQLVPFSPSVAVCFGFMVPPPLSTGPSAELGAGSHFLQEAFLTAAWLGAGDQHHPRAHGRLGAAGRLVVSQRELCCW